MRLALALTVTQASFPFHHAKKAFCTTLYFMKDYSIDRFCVTCIFPCAYENTGTVCHAPLPLNRFGPRTKRREQGAECDHKSKSWCHHTVTDGSGRNFFFHRPLFGHVIRRRAGESNTDGEVLWHHRMLKPDGTCCNLQALGHAKVARV